LLGTDDDRRKLYGMLNFGDYRDFKIGTEKLVEDGSFVLNLDKSNNWVKPGANDGGASRSAQFDKDWNDFFATTIATGAFPVGLAPRTLGRPGAEYKISDRVGFDFYATDLKNQWRLWCAPFRRVTPPEDVLQTNPYVFVAVDGGMIDNEPLELARRYLAAGQEFNQRSADSADRAVVMVSPFPNYLHTPEFVPGERIVDVAPRLLSTCITQARFKPSELELAADASVFSLIFYSLDFQGIDYAT
jgi:hypothetical protein